MYRCSDESHSAIVRSEFYISLTLISNLNLRSRLSLLKRLRMELSPLRYLDNDMVIMLCEQVVLSRKRKLFKVFEYVFTRSKDPTDLNPRLGGHDLSISSKCFVAIMDHLMIDFWRCNCNCQMCVANAPEQKVNFSNFLGSTDIYTSIRLIYIN